MLQLNLVPAQPVVTDNRDEETLEGKKSEKENKSKGGWGDE